MRVMRPPKGYASIGLLLVVALCRMAVTASANGITADAGLTPPVDRWIFRSQVRYMASGDDPTDMGREMKMYASPFVLAYGLRPNVTVIARQIFYRSEMEMMAENSAETGVGDFFLLSKWRLLRINRRDFIIGIAPTIGVEAPTGDRHFGSDTWDIVGGGYFTARRGPWGADLNLEYKINGIEDRGGGDRPGDEFTANLALAYQFTLDKNATMSLWPVIEVTYQDNRPDCSDGENVSDTGGNLLQVSPGLRFAHQSFMLELLLQLPVRQNGNGAQLEREVGGLIGMRYLF